MSEERNDPPVKGKPKSYSASLLGLPTNPSGNSLPAYFEKRYAEKLSQKNIPGTQNPSTSRRIVRDLYESGADLSQIDRIQNRPSVEAKAIQDSPYYNAPPLNFASQFANSFSSAIDSWGRGFDKIMASTDGIEAVKELSKLGQESDVVNWGYLQSNIDKSDETWSWNNLAKGLGNGLGQMTVAVAAGGVATLAAPLAGIGAAGTAIAAGAAGGLSMFPMLFNSQVDDALNNGIDDNHILPYAFTSATVLSALESLPIGRLASKIGVNKIVSEVMQEGIAKGTIPFMKKGASGELIETLVSKGGKVDADVIAGVYKSAKNRIIDRLSIAGVAKDMLPEGMEGFVSNYAESMSKWFYDSNFGTGEKGKGSFGVDGSEVFSANQFKKALFDGFVEALVGSPAAVFTNATRPIYNAGLFHGFYSGEAKGMDVESVAQYYNERINAAAQEQDSDGALLYTPEQIDGARAAVDRAARAYSRIGGRIQDPGFRYMVYDRIGQIDELNSRLTSLQERQAAIQNDINSGKADLSVFTTDVAAIDNEIKRTSEILQYNKDKIAEYSNRYFEREKQLARAATQFIDSSIDDMNMSLKDTDVSPSRMTEFVKEARADFEAGLAQINAQYPDVAPASVNSTLEFSKADVDAMEVIDVSIPVGGEPKVFKVASELVENEDGNPVNVYYNLESADGEVYTARQIPRTRLYMDRLSEVFEAKARFPEVAEAVASGQLSSEEEADFYDRYKSYIDPIVARIKAGQAGAASSAIESGVRLSMISTIQEDAQIYATAQEELNGINEFLGQFSDDDVAGFNSNQKAVYESVLTRKGSLDSLISSYNNAIESITSDGFVDLVELEASNPVAYQIYMESMNEYGLLVGEYNSLSEKRKTEEVKKELANVLEKLKAYPGFEISFIQLQKGLEQRAKIRNAMDANRVAKENKKMAKLMQLIADKKAAQEKLSAIQSEARSRKIIAHSEKLRSVLDSVSKRGALTLNGNETRIYEANISKLRELDPLAADAIDKDLQILLQGNTQEVNATETKTYENGQEDIPPSLPGGVPVQLDVSGVEPNEGQLPNTVPGMEGGVDTTSETGGSVEGERGDGENIPPADGPVNQEGLPVPNQPTYVTQGSEGDLPSPTLVSQELIGRLRQNGLADDVVLLDPQEMDRVLSESGVDPSIRRQIIAWHGSPYEFKKFSLENIRTGEGTLDEGWGLYFSSSEGVARDYSRSLSEPSPFIVDKSIASSDLSEIDKLDLQDYSAYLGYDYDKILDKFRSEGRQSVVDFLLSNSAIFNRGDANLYRVILFKGKSPDQYRWLDWSTVNDSSIVPRITYQMQSEAFPDSFIDKVEVSRTGSDIYEHLIDYYFSNDSPDPAKDASLFLLRSGIDGNRVSIGNSQYNYVVFDDNQVSIEDFSVLFSKLKDLGIKLTTNGFIKRSPSGKFTVYLNIDTATDVTLIHEFSHAYISTIKDSNPDLYNRGISLVSSVIQKSDPIIEDIRNFIRQTQPDLKGELFQEEVLAEFISRRSEYLMNQVKDSNPLTSWLIDFWNYIKGVIGLSDMSPDKVANITLAEYADAIISDLNSGRNLTQNANGEANQANQEGTQGGVLEGVRDGGQETQGGQDGPELRTEEEVVGGVTQEESAQQAEVDSIDAKISETIQELEEAGVIESEPTTPELTQAKAESNAASVAAEAANPTDGSVLSRLIFMAGATSSVGEAKAITSAIEKLSTGVNASITPGVLARTKNPGTFATKQFPASIDAISASSLKSIGLFDGKISGATAKSPILKGKANLVYNSSKNTFIINFASDSSSAKFIVDGLSISDVHALLKNPDGSDLSIFEVNESGQAEGRSDVGALDSISPELRSAYTMAKYMKGIFPNLDIKFLSESEWAEAKLSQDADGAFGPNGEVLLRKSIATGTTVLHEVGHAVVYALKNGDSIAKQYYKALTNKVKGSKYEKAARSMGIREEDIVDEAIAYALQDKGARFVASERKESPDIGNKSLSTKNFSDIYRSLGAQLKKLFGISSSKSPLDMTIDELMDEVAMAIVSTKDLGVLSAHLDRKSVGASAPQGNLYSLYNRFKRETHHGPASASKPPYYFSSFYDQIMSSGVTRNDIAEFLGYTFSNMAPVASIRRGVAPKISVANPNTESGFKKENAYDVIRGNKIFLSQMASDLYDVANGGEPSQLKVAGPDGDRIISSEELLEMVDTIGKNYYDWYSRNHQLVIENGKEVWVSRDNKAEADSVRANILKALAGDFKGGKGRVMGKVLQIFTSPFFSKFMNFDTISEIIGGESGLFSGINDLRKFDNERAGQAGHKARKLFQNTIDRLNAARVKTGTAYDLLTERIPFEFYNNLDSSTPPQATQADELSVGHLISIWGTIKTQRVFHKRKFERIIQTKSDYLKSMNAELMDLRSKSPKTKEMEARMKSIKNSIKSAEKAIKDAEVALQNVNKYTDLYYNPNAEEGEMGYHSRQDATGLTARGYTFSMDYTKWNFDDALNGKAPYTKIENEYNILLTDDQIKKLQDMFESDESEYKESFDAVWNFFNGAEGRAFIDTVNDTHQSLTGTRADIIDNGYFHTRKYSSIRANDRSIGASAQDLRFLKERESLPGRLIGLDVLSLMNEYVEQNVYYLENARVNESLSNYINNVKLEDVANFQDAALNRKIRSLYEAARDHSETTRDYLQRRRESMKTMKKMGIPYRLWNKIMGNFSRAIFMFNIGTPIKQLGTIFNIIGNTPEISNNNKWRMVPFLLKEGVKSFKTYVAKDGGKIDRALGLSDEVREIMDYMEANIDKGFGTILTRITDISSNTQGVTIDEFKKIGLGQNGDPMNVIKRTWNSVVEKADAYGLEPMRRNDRVVIAAIVKMAKAEVQDRINRNDPAYVEAGVTSINDDFAIREIARMATDLTYKSNNMNMVNDKTPIQNSLDPFAKALTLFSSQPQKIFNTMIQSFIAASRKDFTDPHLNQMARQNLMYGVIVASFYQALITSAWGIMRGGYDEEKNYSQDIAVDTLRGIIGMTPDMTTTTISALMTAFDNKPWVDDVGTLPIADIANDMIASAGAYYDSQDETKPEYIRKRQADKFLVDFTTSWSRVLGFPITATTMLRKVYQDEQQPSTNQ